MTDRNSYFSFEVYKNSDIFSNYDFLPIEWEQIYPRIPPEGYIVTGNLLPKLDLLIEQRDLFPEGVFNSLEEYKDFIDSRFAPETLFFMAENSTKHIRIDVSSGYSSNSAVYHTTVYATPIGYGSDEIEFKRSTVEQADLYRYTDLVEWLRPRFEKYKNFEVDDEMRSYINNSIWRLR